MVSFALLIICFILTFVAAKSTYYILKFLAGVGWWGLGVWWIYTPFTTAGTPPHVVVLLLVFITGLAMMAMPFWYTKTENGTETGKGFRIPFVNSSEEESPSESRQDHVARYEARVNRALRGTVNRRR